jgi:hypothetical protein
MILNHYRKPLVLDPFNAPDGHNHSLFSRACKCRWWGCSEHETLNALHQWVRANQGAFTRPVHEWEIERQVSRAFAYGVSQFASLSQPAPPKKKETEFTQQESVIKYVLASNDGWTVDDLRQESKPIPDNTREVLAQLFRWSRTSAIENRFNSARAHLEGCAIDDADAPPCIAENDFLFCWGKSRKYFDEKGNPRTSYDCHTASFSDFYSRDISPELIVPNPMRALTGKTQEGVEGRPRTKENASLPVDRVFFVVEFDHMKSKDEQAVCHWWLNAISRGRLALVVDSAGKSLHGYYRTQGLPQAVYKTFRQLAGALGCDDKADNMAQLFRCPLGFRSLPDHSQKKQEVIYFNPTAGLSSAL